MMLKRTHITTGARKALYAFTVAGILNYAIYPFIGNSAAKKYVREHSAEVIGAQENMFGICYTNPPHIQFSPWLTFWDRSGEYDELQNTVILSSDLSVKGDRMQRWLYWVYPQPRDVKETLDHELGHAYFDQVRREVQMYSDGGKIETLIERSRSNRDPYYRDSVRFIDEGIADYFRRRMNGINDSDRKYRKCYEFVKPILDANCAKGIELIVLHPPYVEDLDNPVQYQQRILGMLKAEHPSSRQRSF